ncbi:MAG: hypothetical protein ABS81_10770 [Pseudonocardia sp. SCN 72-86]|nr:MAG: hypothetical protein ABS81_10770 [Pseudonocardia sp. SCN 72-86]
MTYSNLFDGPGHNQHDEQPPTPDTPIDLNLVAEIARRAGLDCRLDNQSPAAVHARRAGCGAAAWTVSAGICTDTAVPLAFVGPTNSPRTRLLRNPDERHLAALIVLQALRDDPEELLTHDEAAACGLADGLMWA